MADWYPPERPSSHRASTGARLAAARLAAPLTAVVVVVVVIGLLIWINGRSSGGSGSAAVAVPSSHPAVAASATSATSAPSASPRPTHAHHSASPHPTRHASHHPASPSPTAPAEAAVAPVTVLNNSRIHGLAHEVAAQVAEQGWPISQVGNLQGRVAETTVYYPAGGFAAAEHLAHDFGQIQRLEPQSDAGLQSSGLVLVVTRYWAG